jgi:hypothetical protein
MIEIADTGPAIPEDARPHIFDACFTTKEVGRGTGQGLAIARFRSPVAPPSSAWTTPARARREPATAGQCTGTVLPPSPVWRWL